MLTQIQSMQTLGCDSLGDLENGEHLSFLFHHLKPRTYSLVMPTVYSMWLLSPKLGIRVEV